MDDRDDEVPFEFTGKMNTLTITVHRPKLAREDEAKAARDAI